MRTGERNTFDSVVGRAAALLGAFDARHLSMGVSELSRRSGLPKSTTARLAAELTTHGFLEKAEGTDLKLGTKLFELGELASRQRKLREVALPYMADLRQVSRQTVHLAVLVDTDVMYVEIVRSRDAPRMPSEVGGRLPAHAAGVGKALLAFSPDECRPGRHRSGSACGRSADDHRARSAAARTAPDPGFGHRLRERGVRPRRRLRGQSHSRAGRSTRCGHVDLGLERHPRPASDRPGGQDRGVGVEPRSAAARAGQRAVVGGAALTALDRRQASEVVTLGPRAAPR